ncbi:MAG: amidohydrolase [Bacteroidales bacterium]
MLKFKWFIFSLLSTVIIMSCNSTQKVDLVISNANIYSIDSNFNIYQSMVVDKGKIVALGTNEDINNLYIGEENYNLEGKYVYPGFIDPHSHFMSYGLGLREGWLAGASSWNEVVNRLVEHNKNYPSEWIIGRGWNQTEWDIKEFPTKKLLDETFPDNPVLLTRIDGHAAIANTKALNIAGFNPDTLIAGGEIVIENNEMTGVLIDNAINLVRKHIPAYTKTQKEEALIAAQRNCFEVGLTSVNDAGLDVEDVMLLERLHQEDKLDMKVNVMLSPTEENLRYADKNGIIKTPSLTVRTIKLFADGALGSRGALLIEPYSDAPNTKGLQLETEEYLTDICQKAYKAGYQVAIHCIGDAATRLALDVYEKFLKPNNDLRWRIEHAQTVHPDDLPRFGELSVVPSIQTTHATSDMIWAAERLGKRIETAYIYQDLLKQNGWLPNGSDFPIEHINPLYGFYAGVARKNLNGYPPDGFQMENALSREQALKAMTIWAAKAAFEENEKGSLEPNKYADFVVLKEDLMTIPIDKVPNIKVKMTFVNGKAVYL